MRDALSSLTPGRAPIGFHVTMRLDDGRPIATHSTASHALVRVFLTQGESKGMLTFSGADNHHAALATDRASAGRFARNTQSALVWQLGLDARFEPARIRPLHHQDHAYNAFKYINRQDDHHGLLLDPFREATCLPDMLGYRVIDTSIIARVRMHLPRICRADLLAHWNRGALDEEGPLDHERLADAAAAAFALPDLIGRTPDVVRARRAAVHAAPDASTRLLSDALGLSTRTIQDLRTHPAEPHAVRAVKLQARLRTQHRPSTRVF